jgi:hypothetical protein
MKEIKKPPDTDGTFYKVLAVIGTLASIAGLVVSLIK